ncbi:MAG: hypothetical protein U0975_08370 [Erythrobacter sp.]|nr:hypothetical protein [Erythrobacter sp.]MDZ4272671.1 hypothetical protein [Erythrobacter sp.]
MMLAAVAAALPWGFAGALVAQGQGSGDGVPICLKREGDDGKPLAIIVPALAEKAMSDKGFVPEPCTAAFATSSLRENYRDAVCHMASTYRRDQIAVFERKYGERPGVLCGMAEVAVSQWQLRDGD